MEDPHARPQPRSRWLRTFDAGEPAVELLCFPHAGAGAAVYARWPRLLPATIRVVGVCAPGREDRIAETPHERLRDLVGALADELDRDGAVPRAFFGHSVGALVAFEIARELRRRGSEVPRVLFVSGCSPPDEVPLVAPREEPSDDVLLERLHAVGGRLGRTLHEAPEVAELVLPALRADLALFRTYEYVAEERLACPVVAFEGTRDVRGMEGWRRQSAGRFELVPIVADDHFYVETNAAAVVERIRQILDRDG